MHAKCQSNFRSEKLSTKIHNKERTTLIHAQLSKVNGTEAFPKPNGIHRNRHEIFAAWVVRLNPRLSGLQFHDFMLSSILYILITTVYVISFLLLFSFCLCLIQTVSIISYADSLVISLCTDPWHRWIFIKNGLCERYYYAKDSRTFAYQLKSIDICDCACELCINDSMRVCDEDDNDGVDAKILSFRVVYTKCVFIFL